MEALDENALNIYTDGSSFSHPRRGGIGYRFVTVGDDGHEVTHDSAHAGYKEATNQQMELLACITAIKEATGRNSSVDLSRFTKIVIYTDSMYVVENLNNARSTWPHAGWTTADGTPVRNAELWKELARLTTQQYGIRIDFTWIKGKKSPHAKAVDRLAKASADQAFNEPLTPSRVRRKRSPHQVSRGSVQMEGQDATIHIITDKYHALPRQYEYKYEVVSDDSPYFEAVDFIYSEPPIVLSAGHSYEVRFNDDTSNPRSRRSTARFQRLRSEQSGWGGHPRWARSPERRGPCLLLTRQRPLGARGVTSLRLPCEALPSHRRAEGQGTNV